MNCNYFKDEYVHQISEYRKKVRKETRKQPLHQLDNYDHRGKGSFHLDHIVSIAYGFHNKIEPELIGNICNLRYLWYADNISKRDYLTNDSWDVISYMIEKEMI